MQPESYLDEMLLVEAFKKRQRIEVLKTKAIVVATVNPDKAHEAFMEYLAAASPEYAEIRTKIDGQLMDTFQRGMRSVFVLGGDERGFSATEVRPKDA